MKETPDRIYEETETSLAYRGGQLRVVVGPAQYCETDADGNQYVATGVRITTPHMQLWLDADAAKEVRLALYIAQEKLKLTEVTTALAYPHKVSLLVMPADTTIVSSVIARLVPDTEGNPS